MLQVRENEVSLRNSSGGPEYLRHLEGTLLTMQCKLTFTKLFTLSTPQRKCPMLRKQSQKTLRWQQYPGILVLRYNLHSRLSTEIQRRAFLFN